MFDFFKGKKKVEQKPVYVINGFLDSGKTSFLAYTIGQPYFQTKGTTLLILCEEGDPTRERHSLRLSDLRHCRDGSHPDGDPEQRLQVQGVAGRFRRSDRYGK